MLLCVDELVFDYVQSDIKRIVELHNGPGVIMIDNNKVFYADLERQHDLDIYSADIIDTTGFIGEQVDYTRFKSTKAANH